MTKKAAENFSTVPTVFPLAPAAISILARTLRAESGGALSHVEAIALARKRVCAMCGSPKPADQSCLCFDNGCQ